MTGRCLTGRFFNGKAGRIFLLRKYGFHRSMSRSSAWGIVSHFPVIAFPSFTPSVLAGRRSG
jgi:hypothetical protein